MEQHQRGVGVVQSERVGGWDEIVRERKMGQEI